MTTLFKAIGIVVALAAGIFGLLAAYGTISTLVTYDREDDRNLKLVLARIYAEPDVASVQYSKTRFEIVLKAGARPSQKFCNAIEPAYSDLHWYGGLAYVVADGGEVAYCKTKQYETQARSLGLR